MILGSALIVTFMVVNPQYAPCTTYPIIYDVMNRDHYDNMCFCSSYSDISGYELTGRSFQQSPSDGKWYITKDLRDYGQFYGCTLRLFSPYDVLFKDYAEDYPEVFSPLELTWDKEDETVTLNAFITSNELRRAQPGEDVYVTVMLASYNEEGQLIEVTTRKVTEPQRIEMSIDAAGAARVSLFCTDPDVSPIKSMQSILLEDQP